MTAWLRDAIDRVPRTAVQVLAAYVSVDALDGDIHWALGLSAAALAAILSVLTTVIGSPSWGEAWWYQVLERAVKTFAQSVVGGIGVSTMYHEVNWDTVLTAAGLAAAYSVGTSVLTTRAGARGALGSVYLTAPPSPAAARAEV